MASDAGASEPGLRRLRVAAYCVCTDERDRVLLARWRGIDRPQWTLPGGGLDFGEHPQTGAERELREETGYTGRVEALLGVDLDHPVDRHGKAWDSARVVYRADVVGGVLTDELDGSTDRAAWIPREEIAGLDRVPLVDAALAMERGLPRPVSPVVPSPVPASALPRASRLTAYGRVRDAAGALLVVRGSPGTTWPEHWLLPGGGVEPGESYAEAIRREALEETGLEVEVGPIALVTSDVVDSVSRQRQLWTVRIVCEATAVGGELRPEVAGSSDQVAWLQPAALAELPLMPFLREVLAS